MIVTTIRLRWGVVEFSVFANPVDHPVPVDDGVLALVTAVYLMEEVQIAVTSTYERPNQFVRSTPLVSVAGARAQMEKMYGWWPR